MITARSVCPTAFRPIPSHAGKKWSTMTKHISQRSPGYWVLTGLQCIGLEDWQPGVYTAASSHMMKREP